MAVQGTQGKGPAAAWPGPGATRRKRALGAPHDAEADQWSVVPGNPDVIPRIG